MKKFVSSSSSALRCFALLDRLLLLVSVGYQPFPSSLPTRKPVQDIRTLFLPIRLLFTHCLCFTCFLALELLKQKVFLPLLQVTASDSALFFSFSLLFPTERRALPYCTAIDCTELPLPLSLSSTHSVRLVVILSFDQEAMRGGPNSFPFYSRLFFLAVFHAFLFLFQISLLIDHIGNNSRLLAVNLGRIGVR